MSDRQVMVLASSIAGIENDEELRTALQGLSVCTDTIRSSKTICGEQSHNASGRY